MLYSGKRAVKQRHNRVTCKWILTVKPTILLAWIGFTDLRAARGDKETGLGPIAQAVADRTFSRIYLLSNYDKKDNALYRKWLSARTDAALKVIPCRLSGPTKFDEIYESAVSAIKTVKIELKHKSPLFTYHLSPGTPAMAAIWILLAKTSHPGELIESSRERGVQSVSFPFEVAADYIPVIKSRQDDDIRKLARALPPEAPEFKDIIHRCDTVKRLIEKARLVATHDVPVLLLGESGTGKELVARAIHASSQRMENPFVAVNCGAIPNDMFEAEFFGYEKGAFTGSVKAHTGYFESANKGTLFLDEIGELPQSAQVKLLRAIQDGTIKKLGSDKSVNINFRIIAATNRDLINLMAKGVFRSDLFHRIAVGVLHLPPLRQRRGDLPLLVDSILERINRELSDSILYKHKKISVSAKNLILQHDWLGNVRELINTLSRAAIWGFSDTITAEDIKEAIFSTGGNSSETASVLDRELGEGFNLPDVLSEVAEHYLKKAIEQAKGNKTVAAKLTGLSNYQTFSNWLTKYNVNY